MVVVGGGVGGLAAAHRLGRLAAERSLPVEVVLLEATARVGGVLGSPLYEGARLERGPDTLVTHKPAAVALARRLGLGERLVFSSAGQSEILHRGRAVPVPPGFALLAPTRLAPLLSSPLLGWPGRLRAAVEPRIPAARNDSDESVGSFVRRRYGTALLERIVEPMVGAIYMADVDRLSLAATFPRFRALEREHGSVGKGLRRAAASRQTDARPAATALATLADGLGDLADALVAALPPGAVRVRHRVAALARDGERWVLRLTEGGSLAAEAVLLASPAHAAAAILAELDPPLAGRFGRLEYASCATVHVAWPRRSLARPPRSHGVFVPRSAGLGLVAATFVDVKHPQRVPPGQVVARAFLGGALHPDVAALDDDALAGRAAGLLGDLLGAGGPPLWSHVARHERAMPQLAVGHPELVEALRKGVASHPGLEVAGGPLGAYGLPDVIDAAERAAERLLDALTTGS